MSLIDYGLQINKPDDLEKFQNKSLEFPENIRKELIEKTERALVLSFLMGMDHAESKIELEDIIPVPLSFEEAVKLFKIRVPMTKKEWSELEKKLRFRAFTVARLTEVDAIEAVRRKLTRVLEEGKTLSQFWDEAGKDELLKRAGFFRGDPWYWETVFRTNIQTAYNTGRAYQFKKNPTAYLEFIGITDVRQTPMCRARSGVIRRADDPFWNTNWPPLHYNCRSTVRGVHKEEAEAFELKETARLPEDKPVKGFGLNPLKSNSFWKMTDRMIERAIKYGIMDEINRLAKSLKIEKIENSLSIPHDIDGIKQIGEDRLRNYISSKPKNSMRLKEDISKHNIDWWKEYGKQLTKKEMVELINKVVNEAEIYYFIYRKDSPQLAFYAHEIEFKNRILKRVCVTYDLTNDEYSSIFKIREKYLKNKPGLEKLW